MGLHVDVSHLTQDECFQIVSVIAKDIALRKFDQERIRRLRKDFDDLRRSITLKSSKRRSLDNNCQICGRLLLNLCCFFSSGERCLACEHLACSKCRHLLVDATDNKNYLCFLCVKKRDLKRKCFDWFYDAVSSKFKRFGSAKVLRGLYRCHKADARVINLLAVTREMTLSNTVQTSSSRRTSAIKAPSGYSSVRSSSPTASSLSESENIEKKKLAKSKSTDDMGPLKSGSFKSQRPKPSRKLSAPAMISTKFPVQQELAIRPLEPPLEERGRDSSENSEFEVIPDDITQHLSGASQERETSFTVKIFDEVEFITLATIAFVLALFLSLLACVGYIDVVLTESEEENNKED